MYIQFFQLLKLRNRTSMVFNSYFIVCGAHNAKRSCKILHHELWYNICKPLNSFHLELEKSLVFETNLTLIEYLSWYQNECNYIFQSLCNISKIYTLLIQFNHFQFQTALGLHSVHLGWHDINQQYIDILCWHWRHALVRHCLRSKAVLIIALKL